MANSDRAGEHQLAGLEGTQVPSTSAETTEGRSAELLGRIASAFGEGGDLGENLLGICSQLTDHLQADAVSAYLVALDGHHAIRCEAGEVVGSETIGVETVVDLDGWVVRSGPPDARHQVFGPEATEGRGQTEIHGWCQSVEWRGQLLAVLYLERRSRPWEGVAGFLTATAQVIASSMASYYRFEELRRHATLAEIVSQVSRVALEGRSTEDLMYRVVCYLEQRLDVTIANILLLDEAKRIFEVEVHSGELELETPGEGNWPIEIGVCGRAVRKRGTPAGPGCPLRSGLRSGKLGGAVRVHRTDSSSG